MTTQSYRYARPSAVSGGVLGLATSGGTTARGPAAAPHFFSGTLVSPAVSAAGLSSLADVARTRYFQPRPGGFRDPVITSDGERLRMESFSACAGVYARLDLLAEALDGDVAERGTTNIDVNGPLREALARIGGGDPLHLAVGADEVVFTSADGATVEKKVPLPDRWLRSFGEVQAIVSSFDLRASLTAAEAVRFLRALPRRGGVLWAVPSGRSLRLSARPAPGAVCLAGPERLAGFARLLRFASGLHVYGPAVTAASGPVTGVWELELPGQRFVLTLSPETTRGFSGEGAVLDALVTDEAADDADLLAALLSFESRLDPAELAERSGLGLARTRAALTQLGAAGKVGYDTAQAAYFHRELPYDVARIAALNPRLRAARALAGAVSENGPGRYTVVSGGEPKQVRLATSSCTCAWWGAHRGSRGPCKHVLAARLFTETR